MNITINHKVAGCALYWHFRSVREKPIATNAFAAQAKEEYERVRKWELLAQKNPTLCKELQSLVDSAPLPVYTDNSDFPEPGL
jgi:hypothetical protein